MEITTEVIQKIARACHEANRSYCAAIGDISQIPWEESPEDLKAVTAAGVLHHLMNPDTTPEEAHLFWSELKKKQGWSYGETKDEALKKHPCLVDYKDLPQNQRVKDYLFSCIVKQSRFLLGV